jgi:hypothetical protein
LHPGVSFASTIQSWAFADQTSGPGGVTFVGFARLHSLEVEDDPQCSIETWIIHEAGPFGLLIGV